MDQNKEEARMNKFELQVLLKAIEKIAEKSKDLEEFKRALADIQHPENPKP